MVRTEAEARAVFLDRDGVLTRSIVRDGKPYAPTRFEDFSLLPGVESATRGLRDAGFRLIVVTNQPDVATGRTPRSLVERMHQALCDWLPVDEVRVCYHVDEDGCVCRKPKPGMLLDAARQWGIDLPASFMVGDRWRDVEAGQAAGCRTILVDSGHSEERLAHPDASVDSLAAAARLIVEGRV